MGQPANPDRTLGDEEGYLNARSFKAGLGLKRYLDCQLWGVEGFVDGLVDILSGRTSSTESMQGSAFLLSPKPFVLALENVCIRFYGSAIRTYEKTGLHRFGKGEVSLLGLLHSGMVESSEGSATP